MATNLLSFFGKVGWDLSKALANYYGLKDYFSFRYYETFDPEKITEIYSYHKEQKEVGDELFWKLLSTGKLLEGDKVKLVNFQISPWFPRRPGLYWTYEAALARRKAWANHIERAERDFVVFDVMGKTLMAELGGIGSVNFRKDRKEILITATSSGYTDSGIPIICTDKVWNEINSYLKNGQAIEADINGVIEPVSLDYDSFLLRQPRQIPKVAVKVTSLLNVGIKKSDTSIIVYPWTIFEMSNEQKPFGFTFFTHDLFRDNLDESVRWITDYVAKNKGELIITDFDEEKNFFDAHFPLSECLRGNITEDQIFRYCQKINRKFRN